MITVNLQWLAVIPGAYGIWSFFYALMGIPLLFGIDIEPIVGLAVLIIGLFKTICAAGLSWLIWRAFRETNYDNHKEVNHGKNNHNQEPRTDRRHSEEL